MSAQDTQAGVRRHHTISAASRTARAGLDTSGAVPGFESNDYNEDEVVDGDWVGGLGVVGEKTGSLHRQASLPTGYHRAFQGGRQAGSLTPRAGQMNSLSAIAGHEGDEEDWEREIQGIRNEEDLADQDSSAGPSPMSSQFSHHGHGQQIPSPPLADSGVRRHQSLTYGPNAPKRASTGLKRAGTLQAASAMKHPPIPRSPSPTNAEDEHGDEEQYQGSEEGYFKPPGQYGPGSPARSPWGTPGERWQGQQGVGAGGVPIDDVSRALSTLEIASNQQYNYQQMGMRGNGQNNGQGRKLQLVTDLNGKPTQMVAGGPPISAAPFVPQPGASMGQQPQGVDGRAYSAHASNWDQKDRVLAGRSSNGNLQYAYQQGAKQQIPGVPAIPAQYLNQQGGQRSFGQAGGQVSGQYAGAPGAGAGGPPGQDGGNFLGTPIDVPTLIATKGYNPVNFDIKPSFARYFVIKSYTEDDVHKSLKYEIWSSTDPGNKRLDKAFKETAGRGPIYLFFSVNASGHFCGMAEMLTPVDYTRSSTVWASDKWKGVFKVRWIFVRDIPNANLRHIKLNNTQERKPVTNSRDTQELLMDAGQEMLRIFHTHPARTSLLQDFAFYELQAMQKAQAVVPQPPPVGDQQQQALRLQTASPPAGAGAGATSPTLQQQHPFAMSNPNALAYASQHMQVPQQMMNPMMNPQYAMQSVMRHPSPVPPNGQQQYMSMGGPQF